MADVNNVKEPFHSAAIADSGRLTLLDKDQFHWSKAFDIDRAIARKELDDPQSVTSDSLKYFPVQKSTNQYRNKCIAHLKPKPKDWARFLPSDRPKYDSKKLLDSSKKTSFANRDKSKLETSSVQQKIDIKKILKSVNDILKPDSDDGNDQDKEKFGLDQNRPATTKDKLTSSDTLQSTEIENKQVITDIRNTDVLFGRGAQANHHTGNKRFRDLVNQHRPDYVQAQKIKKLAIAQLTVDTIRKSNPPGRFLKRDEGTGFWYDVGDKQATQKASQALREKPTQDCSEARSKIVAELKKENSDEARSRSGQVSLESELVTQDHSQNVPSMNTSTKAKTRAVGKVSLPTKRAHQNDNATSTFSEKTTKRLRSDEDAFVGVRTNAALRNLIDTSSSRRIPAVNPILQATNREMNFNAEATFVPNVMPSRTIEESLRLLANGALHNRSHHPNAQLAGYIPSMINTFGFQQVNPHGTPSLPMILAEMERRQLLDAKLKLIQQNSVEMASRQFAEERLRRQVAEAFIDRQRKFIQEMGISHVDKVDCKEARKEEKPQDGRQEFNKNSSRSESQGENIEVTDYDILCGRGGMTNYHKGNKRFREIISRHRPDYVKATKVQKPKVARLVVKEIREGNPLARFLKKDEVSGTWYEIGDKKATEKVSQALREKEK